MKLKTIKLTLLVCLEYIKRNKQLFALTIIFFVSLILTQLKFNILFGKSDLRIGLVGTYQEHDIPQDVGKLLSKGLVEADENGQMKPNLLEGWEVNNDATVFKFKLKSDLKWSDGTPIKATDLNFAIPNTELSVLDEKTLQFKLKESYSPFPSLFTKPVFKKGTLLGTGPYKIEKIEKSKIFITKISLVSDNEDLPLIFIRFYPSEKVAVTGFNLGEVAVVLGLSNPKQINHNPQASLKQSVDFSKIVTILYSSVDPIVSNRSLRQALSFASPKLEGEETANNPFSPTSWAYDPDSKKYLSNIEEAKLALERAKSAIDKDKLKQELILTATPNLEGVANKVVSGWNGLGFKTKLRIESGIPQNFQTLLITQSIPEDPDQYFLWHSSQEKTNLTKYSSVRVDKDLEDGRKAMTDEERKAKYFDFQKTLLEDAPATFLYFPKYNIVYLKKVEPLLDKILSL